MNTDLYNELRDKIAIAFETQVAHFLPDVELNSITDTLYPELQNIKEKTKEIEYYIHVEKFGEHEFDTMLLLESDVQFMKFLSSIKICLFRILDNYEKDNPNKSIEKAFYNIKMSEDGKSFTVFLSE